MGAFHTSYTWEIEAITGLISIHLHLQKMSGRHQLRTSSLLSNYIINSPLENRHVKNSLLHCLSLEDMTIKQWLKIKSSIVDANSHLNKFFSSFNSLNCEFYSGFKLIDNFPSCFSFYQANHKDKESKKAYLCKLDEIFENTLIIVIISDTSIKNNVATLILHVHSNFNSIKKTFKFQKHPTS